MANNAAEPIDLSSDDDSQPRGPIYECWQVCDELLILETLAAERRRSGNQLPNPDLFDAVRGDLKRRKPTPADVTSKVNALKRKFRKARKKGGPGNNDRDQMLYELSMVVWPDERDVVVVV